MANPQKLCYPTNAQKRRLADLLEADEDLRNGKFSSTITKKECERRWRIIATDINSLMGANKSWEEWRKTWQDMRCKAKKKFSDFRRMTNLTGGGPPPEPPTEIEEIVLGTINQSSLVGHTDCVESEVSFRDLTLPTIGDHAYVEIFEEVNNPQCPHPSTPAEVEIEIDNTDAINVIEVPEQPQKTRKKTLKKSLEVATALKNTLDEKNKIKKDFYENCLKEMKRQTDALLMIAEAINKP